MQIGDILSIADLKQRLTALKACAQSLEDQSSALIVVNELFLAFHDESENLSWRKACLKTAVFLINKHKIAFTEPLITEKEHQLIHELETCSSPKEQFILFKSYIKLVRVTHTDLLNWLNVNSKTEFISKIYDKLLPLIQKSASLAKEVVEEPPTTEVPQIEAVPESVEEPPTAEVPQIEAVPEVVEEPPTAEVPQIEAVPETVEEPPTAEIPQIEAVPEVDGQLPVSEILESDSTLEETEEAEEAPISEMPEIPESMPEIPDLPDDDDLDDSDVPAQLRADNDPSLEEKTTFHPLRGRSRVIGLDHPQLESPRATWVAFICILAPIGLIFRGYQSADGQSLIAFLSTYLGVCIFSQMIFAGQLFISGNKPSSWGSFLIPTRPLYSKTSHGNPVCSQPLAIICGVIIVLSIYAQPKLMELRSKKMSVDIAVEATPTEANNTKVKVVTKTKPVNTTKKRRVKRKRKKKTSNEPEVQLPEVSYADIKQEFVGRSEEVVTAVYQHRLATLRMESKAMAELAYFFDTGEGVKENRILAYTWYTLAIKHGNEDASSDAQLVKAQLSQADLKKVDEYLAMELTKIPFTAQDAE